MSTQAPDTDDEPIREAMLAVIRRTIAALPPIRVEVRSAAMLETALEANLGVPVTVSMPRNHFDPLGSGGALIRVHGADRIRRFQWVEDQVLSLDVPARK